METVSQDVQNNHPFSGPDLDGDCYYLYLDVVSCLTFKSRKLYFSVSS